MMTLKLYPRPPLSTELERNSDVGHFETSVTSTHGRPRCGYTLRNDAAHQHQPEGDSEGRAVLVFYEKPGCRNNKRQRLWLEQAGHQVEARNLLTHRWTASELTAFFGALPVEQWFNRSAPRLKSGEIQPERLSRTEALDLLLDEPLLIRRPLMFCAGHRVVGFDIPTIDRWIGLPEQVVREQLGRNTEACLNE